MDKTFLIELVRDVAPLWDKQIKSATTDLKPKFWDAIEEKLNFTGQY
jgi:hypothetical protein